jgi:hypothetical protein
MPVTGNVNGLAIMQGGRLVDVDALLSLLERCKFVIELEAEMVADVTRHAPLDPESQSKHDSTEYPSERWLDDYKRFTGSERQLSAQPQFVYLLTNGTSGDGEEWKCYDIFLSEKSADAAKKVHERERIRPDGTTYHYCAEIEKWPINP